MTAPSRFALGPNARHRLSLAYGNPDAGLPLPEEAASLMHRIFGCDFSGVRIHQGDQARQLGVSAFNHGTDIYFSPGRFDPATRPGLALLAHELTHVVQQSAAQAQGVDPACAFCWEQPYEHDADAVADLVHAGDHEGARAKVEAIRDRKPLSADWSVVRPYISLDGRRLTSTSDTMRALIDGITDNEVKCNFYVLKEQIRPILKQWINSPDNVVARFITGNKENTRDYENWNNMARALLGEARGQGNLAYEEYLATQTTESDYISYKLDCYIERVWKELNSRFPRSRHLAKIKSTFQSYKGPYSWWYPFGGISAVLKSPKKHKLKHKMACIHDIGYAFSQEDDDYEDVPNDKCVATALVDNRIGGYRLEKKPMLTVDDDLRFRRGHLGVPCTVIENVDIISTTRWYGMPISFGPSFTTGRIMQVAHKLGAPLGERIACAWGIFAFWNLNYSQKYSRIHRFHATMDMASNYDVPYNPFCYPKRCPTWGFSGAGNRL